MKKPRFSRVYVRTAKSYCYGQPHDPHCSCSSTDAHHFLISFASSEGVCLKCGTRRLFKVGYKDTTIIQKKDPDLSLIGSPLTYQGARLVLPSGYHEL